MLTPAIECALPGHSGHHVPGVGRDRSWRDLRGQSRAAGPGVCIHGVLTIGEAIGDLILTGPVASDQSRGTVCARDGTRCFGLRQLDLTCVLGARRASSLRRLIALAQMALQREPIRPGSGSLQVVATLDAVIGRLAGRSAASWGSERGSFGP